MQIKVHCAHDEMVGIGKLKPNPANPNKHPPEQIKLAKIIKAQGWRNPIVVSNRSGLITKGHARLAAAEAIGCKTVPVDRQDYGSEKEELSDMIADNRIAELAEADRSMLRERANDVFDFPIGCQKDVANHPCPKPLKFWLELLVCGSSRGENVFDPFVGAGTSIIAAENSARICYGMDISPLFAGISIQRWADATGKTPKLLNGR